MAASAAASNDSAAAARHAPAHAFDPHAARAALDALASALHGCKLRTAGRVKLTFAPDGHVASAKVLAPYAGTRRGQCLTMHLKSARVDPFQGPDGTLVYTIR